LYEIGPKHYDKRKPEPGPKPSSTRKIRPDPTYNSGWGFLRNAFRELKVSNWNARDWDLHPLRSRLSLRPSRPELTKMGLKMFIGTETKSPDTTAGYHAGEMPLKLSRLRCKYCILLNLL